MSIRLHHLCALLLMGFILIPCTAQTQERSSAHRTFAGVVVKQGTSLAVKTPDGATYQVNENQSHRHGHAAFKEGDEVSVVVDENNTAIDLHHKGEEGQHTFVTGKLIHLGKMEKQVKLQTTAGEKVFPLTRQEIKTKGIDQGTEVTVELNESGAVIDLHRAK